MWYRVRQSAVNGHWYIINRFTGNVVNDFGAPEINEFGHDVTYVQALTLCKAKNDMEWRDWSRFQMANFANMGKW